MESASLILPCTLDPYLSAVQIDKPLGERESKAGPLNFLLADP